jgi:hypothetical protein
MLPSVEYGRRCRGSGLPAQHSLGGLKALEEPEQRGSWCQRPGWRFGCPMRWSTHRLSSVPASTYMFVESSDSWSSRSAMVAMANRPKICCAHDSAIEIAAFRTGRVQHASSRMPFALQNPTQHSSERNIGRQCGRRPSVRRVADECDPAGARVTACGGRSVGRHDVAAPRLKQSRRRQAPPHRAVTPLEPST